jgi:serine/threonine-protein kinase
VDLAFETAGPLPGRALETVKRYDVIRCVGEGGMGRIYEAHDPVLDRRVALKVMKPGVPLEQRLRFRREAIFGARFCHPSIARVFDMGYLEHGGGEWFSMEYLDGTDMEAVVDKQSRRGETAPLRAVVDVFRQVLAALQYAHDCRVVHRDVKPANIFVTRDPNTSFVTTKLLDFGVAVDLAEPGPPESSLVGDPCYMAPEQTRLGQELGPFSDVYATGMSFYEIVTGRHPFHDLLDAPLYEMLEAQRTRVPLPPSLLLDDADLDAVTKDALDVVVARACAKDPWQRYASARAMQADVLSLVR